MGQPSKSHFSILRYLCVFGFLNLKILKALVLGIMRCFISLAIFYVSLKFVPILEPEITSMVSQLTGIYYLTLSSSIFFLSISVRCTLCYSGLSPRICEKLPNSEAKSLVLIETWELYAGYSCLCVAVSGFISLMILLALSDSYWVFC